MSHGYASCWAVLGLEQTKDIKAIKSAYAKLAQTYHPEDNPEMFQKIQSAYKEAMDYAKSNDDETYQSFAPDATIQLENIDAGDFHVQSDVQKKSSTRFMEDIQVVHEKSTTTLTTYDDLAVDDIKKVHENADFDDLEIEAQRSPTTEHTSSYDELDIKFTTLQENQTSLFRDVNAMVEPELTTEELLARFQEDLKKPNQEIIDIFFLEPKVQNQITDPRFKKEVETILLVALPKMDVLAVSATQAYVKNYDMPTLFNKTKKYAKKHLNKRVNKFILAFVVLMCAVALRSVLASNKAKQQKQDEAVIKSIETAKELEYQELLSSKESQEALQSAMRTADFAKFDLHFGEGDKSTKVYDKNNAPVLGQPLVWYSTNGNNALLLQIQMGIFTYYQEDIHATSLDKATFVTLEIDGVMQEKKQAIAGFNEVVGSVCALDGKLLYYDHDKLLGDLTGVEIVHIQDGKIVAVD